MTAQTNNTFISSVKIITAVYFLITLSALAQVSRAPASAMDEETIIVPVNIQKNILEDFHNRHEAKLTEARRTVDEWARREQHAIDYGYEDASFLRLPTPEEKERFFKRNYLRFMSKDVKRAQKDTLRETWKSWTADDEIEAISEFERQDKFLVKAQKKNGAKEESLEARIKVGKKRFKLKVQPRIELGMVKIIFDSEYIKMKAFLGANGNQEVKFEKYISSTGTRALAYYYIDETRLLTSVDQKLYRGLTFRATHEKEMDKFDQLFNAGHEVNTFQVRFNMGF